MPEVKTPQKTLEGVLEDNHYPSSVDNLVRNDKPFEGTDTSLPPSDTNPVFGSDGKLPISKITKIQG